MDQNLQLGRRQQENQPPSCKPCFRRRSCFIEQTSGIWLRDPIANAWGGLGAPGAASSRERPRPCPRSRQFSGTCKYLVSGESECLPAVLKRNMACWDLFPVLSPKYPLALMLKACCKKTVICWDSGQGVTFCECFPAKF